MDPINFISNPTEILRGDPKMYEENKIPNTDDKGLDYSNNGLNSSSINEIIEMQNN